MPAFMEYLDDGSSAPPAQLATSRMEDNSNQNRGNYATLNGQLRGGDLRSRNNKSNRRSYARRSIDVRLFGGNTKKKQYPKNKSGRAIMIMRNERKQEEKEARRKKSETSKTGKNTVTNVSGGDPNNRKRPKTPSKGKGSSFQDTLAKEKLQRKIENKSSSRRSLRGGGRTLNIPPPVPGRPDIIPGSTYNNGWYVGEPCNGSHCGVPTVPSAIWQTNVGLTLGNNVTPGSTAQFPVVNRPGNSFGEPIPGAQMYQGTASNPGPYNNLMCMSGGNRRSHKKSQRRGSRRRNNRYY